MRSSYVIFLLLFLHFSVKAQNTDTTTVLTLMDVMDMARENHPIISQANLQESFADAELRKAKGYFDPKISSSYNTKELKGTDYYSKFKNTLKIPTWFPVDPKVEVSRNQGDYLNRENYISSATDYWQVSAGISIPVGKGLFIDERRTLVKQAKLYSNLAEAEQIKLTNKVLLTIAKAYWDWYQYYEKNLLMARSMEIANTLFERVKMDYEFGEAAVVDTVQANITYQSRFIDFQKSKLELQQARLALGIHLWGPGQVPMELTETTIPADSETLWIVPEDSSMAYLYDWASKNHPDIIKLDTKQDQLEVEQRWNRESLKPEVNISYSLIDAPFANDGYESPQWNKNYKLGLDFSFPIFLRKERGNLQKTQMYIQQVEFDRQQRQQEVVATIQSKYAELKTNEVLVNQYRNMADNYDRLLDAEFFNLESGESDLFKLNIQQDKFIDAQVKYINAKAKYEKLKVELPYLVGIPNLYYQNLYE